MEKIKGERAGKIARRKIFLEKGFALFSERSIEAVTLQDVADASGHGIATLYRYFNSKPHFLVKIAEWKWAEFFRENRKRRPNADFTGKTAAALNGGNPALPGHGSSNNEPPSGPPYTLDANNGTFNDQTVLMTGLDGKLTSLPTHPDANMRFTGRFTLGGREITLDSVFAADAAVFAELRKKTNSTRTLTLTSDPAGAGTLEGGGELE